jgi:hypothetical protein
MIHQALSEIDPKKSFYIALTMVLGSLLGFLTFAIASVMYDKLATDSGFIVQYNQVIGGIYSPYPAYTFFVFTILGFIGGYFLGQHWWHIVYVEHRHWSNRVKA